MKPSDNILEQERRQKEYILNFVREHKLIQSHDNVISAEKIFVINASLRWAIESVRDGKMTAAQWKKFQRTLAQYAAGVVKIKWVRGKPKSTEVANDRRKR
jgi:hypothetical protein